MSYQSRAFYIIGSIKGELNPEDATDEKTRIIDSFFLSRNDLTNRLEFVADRTNPTDEEKARILIESFRQFGEITVCGQARLIKQAELEPQIVEAENSAESDFSEVI